MCFTTIYNEKNAFLRYKNKRFKKSKRVNYWFLSKNGHFSNFFFQAIQARKMYFTIFQKAKTPFQAIKTRTSNTCKIEIFPKELTSHRFGPTIDIFLTFFLGSISQGNGVLRHSTTKNTFLGYKTIAKKRTIQLFPKRLTQGSCQKWLLSQLFFLGNIGQESVFYDILERKNAFLGYTKKQIQKLEKLRLFQRVWSKNGRFSIFFFRQYRPAKRVIR